jgi:3-keto-5-aminohexanoate cleavage enzyme
MKKLIIEVRVNEYAMRDENPNVPWTAGEIARDAAEIEAAGASMLHFHARKPDGSPAHAYEDYAEVIGAIRDAGDLMVHPTLGQITIKGMESRVAHIPKLAAAGRLKPEFASIDLGSTNLDRYDRAAKRFITTDKSYVNTTESLIHFAKTFRECGVRPAIACWAAPFVRTLEPFFDMGLLPDPTWVLLIHSDDGVMGGHPPTPAGLRAFLDFLPQGRPVEWSVCSKPGNLFATAAQAIQLGGHVSIGIGDNPYTELGAPTNAELVRRVVEIARAFGREVATPREARAMLGIEPR